MFCSTLGTGAPVPSPPNDGRSRPAEVMIAVDIAPMLALSLSDATPPSSGESNTISSAEVPGLPPSVSLVELVEVWSLVALVACAVEIVEGLVVVGAAVEEAEEVEEDEEMM